MTDNETIKALECCKKAILHQDCLDLKCPLVREFGCNLDKEQLRNMALDLINRLKAEKEKCESQMKLLEAFVNDYKLAYEKAKAEIERLQKDKADIIDAVEYRINQAKEIAYKEFAERVKQLPNVTNCEYEWTYLDIDNLLAELTPEPLTKIDHSSLCETETYEGK